MSNEVFDPSLSADQPAFERLVIGVAQCGMRAQERLEPRVVFDALITIAIEVSLETVDLTRDVGFACRNDTGIEAAAAH